MGGVLLSCYLHLHSPLSFGQAHPSPFLVFLEGGFYYLTIVVCHSLRSAWTLRSPRERDSNHKECSSRGSTALKICLEFSEAPTKEKKKIKQHRLL